MSAQNSVIPKAWNIPDIFRARMGKEVGRQRLMSEEGHHLVVLHEIPTLSERGQRKPMLFWVDDAGDWKSMPQSGGRSALKQHVSDYQNAISALEQRMTKVEGDDTPEEVHDVIDEAAPLHRSVRGLARVMQALRETLKDDREVLNVRDMAVSMESSTDLLLADAKSTLDFVTAKNAMIQAKESAKAAREAQKLNRLAALFFPLVTLASVFGMNAPSQVLGASGSIVVIIIGLVTGALLWGILSKKPN